MTLGELLSNPEFWSALFGAVAGALAAFGLGSAGQWWSANSANRAAGNLALITLIQMYQVLDNIRRQFLVEESNHQAKLLRRDPFEFELRPVTLGLSEGKLQLAMDQLGFLAESHDPDVLARLMTVERAFELTVAMVVKHEHLMQKFQARMANAHLAGESEVPPGRMPEIVGPDVFVYVVLTVRELQRALPDTLEGISRVTQDLRNALRMKLPTRHFLRYEFTNPRRMSERPEPQRPALWRRAVRAAVDALFRPRHSRRQEVTPIAAPEPERQPRIRKFILPTDNP
jgi:hypothetical protein